MRGASDISSALNFPSRLHRLARSDAWPFRGLPSVLEFFGAAAFLYDTMSADLLLAYGDFRVLRIVFTRTEYCLRQWLILCQRRWKTDRLAIVRWRPPGDLENGRVGTTLGHSGPFGERMDSTNPGHRRQRSAWRGAPRSIDC